MISILHDTLISWCVTLGRCKLRCVSLPQALHASELAHDLRVDCRHPSAEQRLPADGHLQCRPAEVRSGWLGIHFIVVLVERLLVTQTWMQGVEKVVYIS